MDWCRRGAVAALVLEYYLLLRSVLRAKPHLRACLTRCRHCRIFLLTHPRNAGRHNLRCPFGCREAHRRQQSTRRSAAYYRDPDGKVKKSALRYWQGAVPVLRPSELRMIFIQRSVKLSVVMVEKNRERGQRGDGQHLSKIDQAVAWLNEQPP